MGGLQRVGASYQHCTLSHICFPASQPQRSTTGQTPPYKSYSKGDFGPCSSWLQFICCPNKTVIDFQITNRRRLCPSTTTQNTTHFKIFFSSFLTLQTGSDTLKMFSRVQILGTVIQLLPPQSQFALWLWLAAKCVRYFYPESVISLDLSWCRSLAEVIACTWPAGTGGVGTQHWAHRGEGRTGAEG